MSSQYKSILKATSIFGGSQVIQILVNLIRSKFVAVLIGAAGMGLSSMYTTTITTIVTIFALGINVSVVRDLTKAHDENDIDTFSKVSSIFNRLTLTLGGLSMIFIMIFSPQLSVWAFNGKEYEHDFFWLSLMSFFTILTQGNTAILISSRRIKETALSSLFGSIVTLLSSIPLFYFFQVKGIVPGLVISTFGNYLITLYFASKVKIHKQKISFPDYVIYGKSIISLGVTMVIGGLLMKLSTYLTNIGISRMGGIEDLGFYNSGMSITMEAVILVFSAMASDYYPRLVTSLKDMNLMNETINQQTEIILYLSVPILSLLMIASPFIIEILLSPEFQVINSFIKILCVGTMLKTASYAIGYIAFAKGDKKVYLFLEGVGGNLMNLVCSLGFYYLLGLKGLAIGYIINYVVYIIIVRIISIKRYNYIPTKDVNRLIVVSLFAMLLLLFFNSCMSSPYNYIFSILLFLTICSIYIKRLNDKTELLTIIINKLWKTKN